MKTYHDILIAPSILASNFSRLGEEVENIASAGADWIHCDVMDGHLVDNLSFGSKFVEAISEHTDRPLDVHLMLERPDHFFPRYVKFATSITTHVEAKHDVADTLMRVRKEGCKAGLAVSPPTPIERIEPYLGMFDLLLVMTVHPGFGGQAFLPDMMDKVRYGVEARRAHGLDFHIEVDGGINPETAAVVIEAGANVLVAGTSVFHQADRRQAIEALRGGG